MPSPLRQIPASAWWVMYVLTCLGLIVSFASPVATGRLRGAVVVLLLLAAVTLAASISYRKGRWFSGPAAFIALVTALGIFSWSTQSEAFTTSISPKRPGGAVTTAVASGAAPKPMPVLDNSRDKQCSIALPTPSPTGSDFEVCMVVRGANGEQSWDTATSPFGLVRVLVEYRNTGALQQDNVVFRAALPSGWSLVPGTSNSANGNSPEGFRITNDVSTVGLNLGSYASAANAWLTFSVQAADPSKFDCGENPGVLSLRVTVDRAAKAAKSLLNVVRKCQT